MTSQRLRSFSWTDQGNAKAMAHLYGQDLLYCYQQRSWYRWNGTLWEEAVPGLIRQLMIQTTERLSEAWQEPGVEPELALKAAKHYKNNENRSKFVPAEKTASELAEFRTSLAEFNADKWVLGLENGYLDLRTGEFHRPDRTKKLTMKANVHYDPKATCPKWIKFIDQIFSGNSEVIDYVQRADGYSLTGSVEEQLMFMCVGDGANGKSTYLNVKRDMLGDYSKAAPFSTFSAKNRSDMTNDLARLMGARYVTIIESDEDALLAEAKIKQATGGDPIPCRLLHKEFFEYIPQFKIWMAANKLPIIRGTDHGNFRRPVILNFDRRFEANERIPDLQDQLYAERAGILNWMLEGLRKWQERKLTTHVPKSLTDAKSDYQMDMDILGKWLTARTEKCDEAPGIMGDTLYRDYYDYVKMIGHFPKSITLWGREMKGKVEGKRTNRGVKYMGINLVEAEWPETLTVRGTV